MINNIQFVLDENTFLRYEKDGCPGRIPMKDVQLNWLQINLDDMEYWSELDEDTFEWGTAKELDDRMIIAAATIASDQNGAVFIWDTEKEKIVHISNAAYTNLIAADHEWVYTLGIVHHFGIKPHLSMCRAPFGTMDFCYSENVQCDFPFTVDEFIDALNSDGTCELDISDDGIDVHMNGNVYRIL